MLSLSRLTKCVGAWSRTLSALVPVIVIVSLLAQPASSFAGRRTRRATAKPATSTTATEQPAAKSGRPAKIGQYNPADETVDMFKAMDAGQISVKFIPKDSTQARVFIKNKTAKPLNVRLPEAFAATQVLAQFGGQGMGGMQMGGGGGGQGMGGGMGGGGGGMFNVPAQKEANLKVPCVCLEHGKAEPRSQMTYTIKPIESFTTKPGVAEMLTDLGNFKIDQRAAQVAAWHLNNGMSWDQLANKRIERIDGSSYPYFSPDELQRGMQISDQSLAAAADTKKDEQEPSKKPSPGETAAK
jgi:hypothetical protein